MPNPEERIKKYYAEESDGIPKNRRMNGIPVRHKKKNAIVFFYMEGARSSNLGPKFRNRTRKIIESRLLDEELRQCDFGEIFSDGKYEYVIVEWWKSLRLRQAILAYGQIVRRAMRIKKTKKTGTKFEFHIVLAKFV